MSGAILSFATLFVGYCRTLGGATLSVAFWRLSLVFNAVGAVFYLQALVRWGWDTGDQWWVIALLAGWCVLAASLSIAVEHQPGLVAAERSPAPQPTPTTDFSQRPDDRRAGDTTGKT